jgi:hypothetical protein
MNQDEVNNLLTVMQKKINELTSQNIMLEAKVIYLSNIITKMNAESSVSDGGAFGEDSASTQKEASKTRRSA